MTRANVRGIGAVAGVLGAFAAGGWLDVTAAVIDVAALRSGNQATVTLGQPGPNNWGSIDALFDRNFNGYTVSPGMDPVTVTIDFLSPRETGATRVWFNPGDTYRWRLEAANTLADLNARSGTWTDVVAETEEVAGPTGPSGAEFQFREWNDAPVTRRFYRWTFDRRSRDDFVHVAELEIQSPEPVTTITVGGQPRRVNQIAVTPTERRLVIGQTQQFHASANLSFGPQSYAVDSLVTWSTDHPSIASVSPTGLATGAGAGATSVNADIGPVHGEVDLSVRAARQTDLDVGYIHRTPEFERFRVDFSADQRIQPGTENQQRWPNPGQQVTYHAFVFNKGDVPAANVGYRWYVDDAMVGQGTIASLPGGGREVVTYSAPWPADEVGTVSIPAGAQTLHPKQVERALQAPGGGHRIRFEIDPEAQVAESSELNNAVEDRLGALPFRFFMDQGTYDRFNNTKNFLETYSAEDWARMQLLGLQRRMAISGAAQKIRLTELVVLPDGALDPGGTHEPRPSVVWAAYGGPPQNGVDFLSDSRWGFTWPQDYIDRYAKRIENALAHELGHQMGLIDVYNYDIATENCLIRLNGQPVASTPRMPLVSPWNVYYGNQDLFHDLTSTSAFVDGTRRAVMASPGERYFGPGDVAGLNRNLGLRRGFFGDYLSAVQQGPIKVRFRHHGGAPVPGAQLRVFQRDYTNGRVPDAPKFLGTTDAVGEWTFPSFTDPGFTQGSIPVNNPWSVRRPNGTPLNGPEPVGGNAPLIIEVSHNPGAGAVTEYHFVDVDLLNVAMAAGRTDSYTIELTSFWSRRTNRLPVISFGAVPEDVFLNEGATFTAHVTATDPDGDPVVLTMTPLDNASFDPATGRLEFRPDSLNVNRRTLPGGGTDSEQMSVVFRADDGKFRSTRRMSFHVSDVDGVALLHAPGVPPCGPDWNRDGAVNVVDIFAFLSSWFAREGDYDGSGLTGVSDIFAFLADWFAGC